MYQRKLNPKRPYPKSKFSHQLCTDLINYCKAGNSVASFPAKCGLSQRKLNEFILNHPAYSDAVEIALASELEYYENALNGILYENTQFATKSAITQRINSIRNAISEHAAMARNAQDTRTKKQIKEQLENERILKDFIQV